MTAAAVSSQEDSIPRIKGSFIGKLRLLQKVDDKALQVAVHDRLHVAHFKARAVILDERLGAEHIGADLRAPLDLFGFALQCRLCLLALLNLLFNEL